MRALERAKTWLGSFARLDGVELPVGGRSSAEDVPALFTKGLDRFGGLQPEISFEALAALKQLVVWSPLMSEFAQNIVNLGNTGHQITIDAANDSQAEAAFARVNETAARLWPEGAGVDGLINQLFFDIAWSGACSSEDVINLKQRRVEKCVIVPVEQIRFNYDGENYHAYQQPRWAFRGVGNAGMIPLNAETYQYYALSKIGSSPYAKPPATAAIEDLLGPYTDGRANLKAVLKKYGLLGFASFQVTPPKQKPGETEEEHSKRKKGFLASVRDSLLNSWLNGLLVFYRDQALQFHNVTGNAQGLEKIWEAIEQQIFSAFGMQPSLFGRVFSVTETFAGVLWAQLDAQVSNIRRLPQRRMQRTYNLDLRLAGLPFNAISLKFHKTPSANALQEAQAEAAKVQTALAKAKAGIISPDQAAQELGYESAYDPELLGAMPSVAGALQAAQRASSPEVPTNFRATFRFDQASQSYRFERPLPVRVGESSLAKKKEQMTPKEIDALFERFVRIYLDYVEPVGERTRKLALDTIRNYLQLVKLTDFANATEFADKLFEQLEKVYTGEWESASVKRVIGQASEQVYRYFRIADDASILPPDAAPVTVRFGGLDVQTLRFFEELDTFYFSKYVNNSDKSLKQFFADEYIAQGGRSVVDLTDTQIEDIRAALGDKLKKVNDVNLERIVRGAVARSRNYAHIGRMHEALIDLAKIVAVLDSRTSEICRYLNGKYIRIGAAHAAVERLVELEPGEFAKEVFESPTGKALRAANENADAVEAFFKDKVDDRGVLDDSLMAKGHGLPPYHVSCRSWLEGQIEGVDY